MRLNFLLALAMLTMLFGCKKDEDNTPQGPEGPPDTWARVIEVDSSYELAFDVAETTDGGFILVGLKSSAAGDGNCVWKLNSAGDTLWSRSYAVEGHDDVLLGVTALPDGGALAVGYVLPTGGTEEVLLIRMNESGSVVWQRVTHFGLRFNGYDVAPLSDGGFIVAANLGLFKIDADGDTVWTRSSDREQLFGVIGLDDGGFIASGTYSVDTDNSPGLVMRFNAQGDTLWTRQFPITDMEVYLWDIDRVGDGEYVTAGQVTNIPGGNFNGTWAAKFTESGQVRWDNTYISNAHFNDLATGPDGLPVMIGEIERSGTDLDILLMKIDNSGAELWTRTYLTALDESGSAITASSDGGFVTVGNVGGEPYPDIIVIKVDADGEL